MALTITCVHQGYELYGSDRSFIESVATLRRANPDAWIDVVLPQQGPIVPALTPYASRIVIEPLWVLRRRDLPRLATVGLLRLPLALWRAAARIRRSHLVYINTSVVVNYTLAARLWPGRTLLHVHELAEGMVRRVLRALLHASRAELIFNSQATRAAFAPQPRQARTHILYNGIAGPPAPEAISYTGQRPLRVLMLGRISRIKGQDILVEALTQLPAAVRGRIALRIVGGAFGDEAPVRALEAAVRANDLSDTVELLPFTPDPAEHFRWADVVVVPSRLPESLGRVAIEALAFGRPPLASDIGGLPEIVKDGVNGWLVPPGDAAALARRLEAIVLHPEAWASFPAAGRAHYEATFSAARVAEAFVAIADATLERTRAAPRQAGNAAGAEA